MILGSHDTMSYCHDIRWWMRPFEVWGRCQDKSLVEQFSIGVRYFDFRLAKVKGEWHFVHGLLDYGTSGYRSVESAINAVIALSYMRHSKIYVRVLFERGTEEERKEFDFLCYNLSYVYSHKNVVWQFGHKNPWRIYEDDFDEEFVEVAKHFDIKRHFLLPVKFWKWEQERIERALCSIKYKGIISKDFV